MDLTPTDAIAAEQAEELRREDEAYAEYLATLEAEGLEPASPEQIALENERAEIAGQMEQDRLDRAREADLGHDYDGREITPGTPEHDKTLAEYHEWVSEWEAQARESDVQPLASIPGAVAEADAGIELELEL